jgi:hypothetical protein
VASPTLRTATPSGANRFNESIRITPCEAESEYFAKCSDP